MDTFVNAMFTFTVSAAQSCTGSRTIIARHCMFVVLLKRQRSKAWQLEEMLV